MARLIGRSPIQGKILKSLREEEWLQDEECLTDIEYLECVHDILKNETFQSMKHYMQHGCTSTLAHCLHVSYYSYKVCKRYGLDYCSAARAGLLHDLYLYDWHTHARETGEHFHGFTHPKTALRNASHIFELNATERDIIVKHMWPLTIIPPKTWEGYVVMFADKHCGLMETVLRFKSRKVAEAV